MKCIYCDTNTNFRTRDSNGGTCSSCRRRFAFEPKTDSHKITDQRFQAAVDAVSDKGLLKFSPEHLKYELARRQASFNRLATEVGVLLVFGFFFLLISDSSNFGWFLVTWLATIPVLFGFLKWLDGLPAQETAVLEPSRF
jgi:hypothetical protein